MENKTRNLELEAWLIETTGEEMMANHLEPNWNRFNDEFCFYPNISMTIADLVWQHQQAKVEEANAKAQMCRDEKNHAINRWSAVCKERDELQKRVDAVVIEIEKLHLSGVIGWGAVKKLEQALKGGG